MAEVHTLALPPGVWRVLSLQGLALGHRHVEAILTGAAHFCPQSVPGQSFTRAPPHPGRPTTLCPATNAPSPLPLAAQGAGPGLCA